MAYIKFRKRALLLKMETVYGIDSVPTGAADALQVENLTITPLELSTEETNYVGAGLGSQIQAIIDKKVKLEFDVDFFHPGALGVAPAYGKLLRSCAMAEVITATTKVEYTEIDASEESATAYFNIGNNLHPLLGARGTWGYRASANKRLMLHFSLEALFGAPINGALPNVNWAAWKKALTLNTVNSSVTVHANAHNFSELTYDHANQLVKPALVGVDEIRVSDRKSGGSIKIEAPALSAINYFNIVNAETLGVVKLLHGALGNRVQIEHNQTQLLDPNYEDLDGTTMLSLKLNTIPSTAGNNATKITLL